MPKSIVLYADSVLVLEEWHASGKASQVPQPPSSESAHISSHPAVHTNETTARRAHTRSMRFLHQNKLKEAHEKAQKKATKALSNGKSRMGPRGEDSASFWGKAVQLESPTVSVLATAATPVMYANPPGTIEAGPGAVGSCAAGTCSGASACGSETLGICTAGCTGVSKRCHSRLFIYFLTNAPANLYAYRVERDQVRRQDVWLYEAI
jgi:hypothetical protein